MESVLLLKEYILVVDTNQESFSFYKDLCAYCTGFAHESSHDTTLSDMFYDEVEGQNCFVDFIADKLDDEGFLAPSCVWLNKRYGCDDSGRFALLDENNYDEFSFPAPLSVGFFFSKEPEQHHIDLIKTRSKKFFETIWKEKGSVTVEGFRLITHAKYGEEKNLD